MFILLLIGVSQSVLGVYNILYLLSFLFLVLCQLSFGLRNHNFSIFLVIFWTWSCTISSSLSHLLLASSHTFWLPFSLSCTFSYLQVSSLFNVNQLELYCQIILSILLWPQATYLGHHSAQTHILIIILVFFFSSCLCFTIIDQTFSHFLIFFSMLHLDSPTFPFLVSRECRVSTLWPFLFSFLLVSHPDCLTFPFYVFVSVMP